MRYLIVVLLAFICGGCIIGKDSRVLKRTTKEWRQSPAVIEGYLDTPFAGIFLTLRKNGKFEHTSSGMFKGFDAGTWTRSQDTLRLTYVNSKLEPVEVVQAIIDRSTYRLIFLNDMFAHPQSRMRVTLLEEKK
ncbi:MAG: hypothetical protein HOP30_00340 [Cyclobacteriaceae bacterium]|nr:hypothetical protein [Cyclobacteriaceae bacterium]